MSLGIMEKTCDTCDNKEICRYMNPVKEKIRKIRELTNNDILSAEVSCMHWRESETKKVLRGSGNEDGPVSEPVGGDGPHVCKCEKGLDSRWHLTTCGPCSITKEDGSNLLEESI